MDDNSTVTLVRKWLDLCSRIRSDKEAAKQVQQVIAARLGEGIYLFNGRVIEVRKRMPARPGESVFHVVVTDAKIIE